MIFVDKLKTCRSCGIPKPLDEFYNQVGGRDGKQPSCKLCKNIYGREWRKMQTIGDPLVSEHMRNWRR